LKLFKTLLSSCDLSKFNTVHP